MCISCSQAGSNGQEDRSFWAALGTLMMEDRPRASDENEAMVLDLWEGSDPVPHGKTCAEKANPFASVERRDLRQRGGRSSREKRIATGPLPTLAGMIL